MAPPPAPEPPAPELPAPEPPRSETAPPGPPPPGPRATVAALLLLTGATGLVDAVSYLRLQHVFAANMTGNVVFLGFGVLPATGITATGPLVAIAGFLAGALAGGRVGAHLDGRSARWPGVSVGGEAVLLAVAAVATGTGLLRPGLVLLALLAAAFGLQNSTVRRLAVPDLTTTVLTLTLVGLAADSPTHGGGTRWGRRLGSVAAMAVGAAVGTVLLQVTVAGVIGLAAALVSAVAVVLRTRPAAAGHPTAPAGGR